MESKIFKKAIKKTALWMGSVTFGFALLFGVILLFLNFEDKKEKIALLLETTFAIVFMYFFLLIVTMNQITIRTIIKKEKIIYEDDSSELKYKMSFYSYLIITIISIAIFFLYGICFKTTMSLSFADAMKKTLAFDFILFFYNILYFFIYLGIFNYLLNENSENLLLNENKISEA